MTTNEAYVGQQVCHEGVSDRWTATKYVVRAITKGGDLRIQRLQPEEGGNMRWMTYHPSHMQAWT